MISWSPAFERLNEEFEMAKKKKEALDNLLSSGRISQSTHELFNKEIDEAIAEIERQQKALLEKMNSKMKELEERVRTLEMLLANFEIQHVTGEVDDEVYQREIGLLSTGLETVRAQLDKVTDAVNQLSSGPQITTAEVEMQEEIEQQPSEEVEAPQPEVEVEVTDESVSTLEEKLPEPPVAEPPIETLETGETESFRTPEETPEETQEQTEEAWQITEESQSTETETEVEENQET